MAKTWRLAKKLNNDRLAPLSWARDHSWYRALLSMAAIGWSRLLGTFRRPKPRIRPELPRAARRRRKN